MDGLISYHIVGCSKREPCHFLFLTRAGKLSIFYEIIEYHLLTKFTEKEFCVR
jgi:hypothetical protein